MLARYCQIGYREKNYFITKTYDHEKTIIHRSNGHHHGIM
jgi:hypothetical protein